MDAMTRFAKELILLAAAGSCVAVGYGIGSVHAEGARPQLAAVYYPSGDTATMQQTSVSAALASPGLSLDGKAAQSSDGAPRKLCTGATRPTAWTAGSAPCSFQTEVDVSGCRFDETQQLLTSLNGTRDHWTMVGGANPYRIADNKFGVQISAPSCSEPLDLAWLRERELRIDWLAVGAEN